jgi:hypothetical protein
LKQEYLFPLIVFIVLLCSGCKRKYKEVRCQWLTPVILTTWEAEIRRMEVRGQLEEIIHESPISRITRAKWTGGLA